VRAEGALTCSAIRILSDPLSNTIYMNAVLAQLRREGYLVRDEDVARLSPLIYDHINVLGRYSFAIPEAVTRGERRPLRDPRDSTVKEPVEDLRRLFRCTVHAAWMTRSRERRTARSVQPPRDERGKLSPAQRARKADTSAAPTQPASTIGDRRPKTSRNEAPGRDFDRSDDLWVIQKKPMPFANEIALGNPTSARHRNA
jgi:hypothetical protein